jgi:signal transduction histidine kinase
VAAELHRGVDALTTEVNDLIAQARRAAEPPRPLDVAKVVAERFDFWSALAADEDRACRCTRRGSLALLPLAVTPEDLAAALDVVLENVFAHTQRGTAFELAIEGWGEGCLITVDDAGPGFDPALAAAGRSGGGSTGLGLAIVERLARSGGGSLTVSASPLGGARVALSLGRVSSIGSAGLH